MASLSTIDLDISVDLRKLKILGMAAEAAEKAINRGMFTGSIHDALESDVAVVENKREYLLQIAAVALYLAELDG